MSTEQAHATPPGGESSGPTEPECESCGVEGETLYAVHRMYVTPEAWDTPGSSRTLDEVERWCFACCSHYPHQPVDG
jgi:hypothetical protein